MPSKPMIARSVNGPFDEISTPPIALVQLLPHLPKEWVIWEAAWGAGLLAKGLRDQGYAVSACIREFPDGEPDKWDCLVTNPPFSDKARWLRWCKELGKPWALLLPVTAIGSRACQRSLNGVDLILLPKRVDFTGKGAPWFSVAWFTWGLGLPDQLNYPEDDE